MDNQNIISWNFTNWITIALMGLGFFMLVGLGMKVYQQRGGSSTSDS